MFRNTPDDIAATLTNMVDTSHIVCRHNQAEMIKMMGEWIANDRRFDQVRDKQALAADILDAKSHGRLLRIEARMQNEWR
jgi:hypothetical protein